MGVELRYGQMSTEQVKHAHQVREVSINKGYEAHSNAASTTFKNK